MRPIWLYTELKNAPTLKTYSAAVDRNVPGHYFAETFSRSGMNPSGQSIRGEIMKKSLASMCLSAVLTVAFSYHAVAADLPEIEKSGTLKVATEDDYAPFNFMNNGQADGFNKDMLEELRKYAKFHVDQSILPWTGLLAAVSTGQYDMALTGAVITDERLKVFDFTRAALFRQTRWRYFVKYDCRSQRQKSGVTGRERAAGAFAGAEGDAGEDRRQAGTGGGVSLLS